jgi:hypothetical protein
LRQQKIFRATIGKDLAKRATGIKTLSTLRNTLKA